MGKSINCEVSLAKNLLESSIQSQNKETPRRGAAALRSGVLSAYTAGCWTVMVPWTARTLFPLLFLSEKNGLKEEFTIRDIQDILNDSLGVTASKKEIDDVFVRRQYWFERTNQNPRKYKLQEMARNYAQWHYIQSFSFSPNLLQIKESKWKKDSAVITSISVIRRRRKFYF